MTREELLQRLRGRETEDFEVKTAANEVPEDAYKTVSAFANTSGGWIVFGVREEGEQFVVSGVRDPEKVESDFLTSCRGTQKLQRPIELRVTPLVIDDAHVLAFYVPPLQRPLKPLRVRVRREWRAYIRLGATDHRCSEQEEARFLRDAAGEPFDWAVCEEAGIGDLDPGAMQWFRGILVQRRPREVYPQEPSELLAKIGLLRDGRLTNAAVLLFGREQAVAALKPGGLVDFRLIRDVWRETAPARRWDDRELCEGNLVAAFRSLAERLYRLVPNPFVMDPNGLQRQTESPDFLAAREALVNLLIHQDFADRVRTATIWWYNDKAIFENPGDSDLTPEELLGGGRSAPRNPTLLRLMRQAAFAEQAGSGIPEIVRVWTEAGRPPPQIVNDPGRKIFRLALDWNDR